MNQLPFAPAIRMTLKRKGLNNNSFNKNCQHPNLSNPVLTKKGVISFLVHSLPANSNPFLTRKGVTSFLVHSASLLAGNVRHYTVDESNRLIALSLRAKEQKKQDNTQTKRAKSNYRQLHLMMKWFLEGKRKPTATQRAQCLINGSMTLIQISYLVYQTLH